MQKNNLIKDLKDELRLVADKAYRDLVRTRYNMNVDNFWGVRTPQIHKIAGVYFRQIRHLPVEERLNLCIHPSP